MARLAKRRVRRAVKIVFLTRSLNEGGAERQLAQLAIDLKGRGHSVTVLTYYSGGVFEGMLKQADVPVESLGKRGRWHILSFMKGLRQRLQHYRPDVLYSFLTTSNVLAAFLARSLPATRIVWGVRVSDMKLTEYGRLDRLIAAAEKRLSDIPAAIVANSEAGRVICVKSGFPEKRLHVIPNSIDTERFRPSPERRSDLRRSLSTMDDTVPLIGMVARYDRMKGVDFFVAAAAQLAKTDDRVRYVLVGTGMHTSNAALTNLIDKVGLRDKIALLGPREDVSSIYPAMDVFTLSSRFGEGFPNVVAEAMASAVPVVATDVGDTALIVRDTGWIVPPEDAMSLSEAWKNAIALPRAERAVRGKAARQSIVDRFDRPALARQSEELLLSVVSNSD